MASQGPGCRECCSYPHGYIVFWPAVSSVLAFVTSLSSLNTCYFILFQRQALFVLNGGFGFTGFGQLDWDEKCLEGNNCDMSGDLCIPYTAEQKSAYFDSAWRTGYAFAILSAVFGGIAMIMTLATCCVALSPSVVKIAGALFLLCSLFQGLTLIGLASDICTKFSAQFENCEYCMCYFGWGAWLACIACVLWFLAACGMFSTPAYKDDGGQFQNPPHTGAPTTTTTVTETVTASGTKVTEKVTRRPDGTETVEKTVEQPTSLT